MQPRDKRPWALSGVQFRPYGLRETVLRVVFLSPNEVKRFVRNATNNRPTALQTVATWRLSSPDQFQELCALLEIRREPIPVGGERWKGRTHRATGDQRRLDRRLRKVG